MRYGQDTLKAPAGFFHGLVDSVVASMGHFYPELVKARDHIVEVIRWNLPLVLAATPNTCAVWDFISVVSTGDFRFERVEAQDNIAFNKSSGATCKLLSIALSSAEDHA